jgi:hypothetical protein
LLPKTQRLEAIQDRNKNGDTYLHIAYLKPSSLAKIFDLLPETQRIDAIQLKNPLGKQVLDKYCIMIDDLVSVLSMIPERDRIKALSEKIQATGMFPIEQYAKSFKALKRVLALLPKDQWFNALDSMNQYRKNDCFLFQIEIWRQKAIQLQEKSNNDPNYLMAANTAKQLINSIEQYGDNYVCDNDFERFKQQCTNAIENSRTILETHRGWKQILGNITLAILGLGVFYAGAILYNKHTTGKYLFFKTDSGEKLDSLSETLGTI